MVALFAEERKCVVFLETAIDIDKIPHIEIDVIPIDENLEEDVKKFFKRTLTEDDYEWSTHKKIIETDKDKGDISKVIPGSFSYFHIDINAQGGFAHVIEDSRKFNRKHALEVVAGCMGDEEVNVNVPINYETLKKRVRGFKDRYNEKYNWTKYKKQ